MPGLDAFPGVSFRGPAMLAPMRLFSVFVVLIALGLPACAQRRCGPPRGCRTPASGCAQSPDAWLRAANTPQPSLAAPAPLSQSTGAPAATPATAPSEALFDGTTGATLTADQAIQRLLDTDVLLFGELHGHAVGADYQLRLLQAAYRSGRPVALAMEFMERDVQPVVNRYLRGAIDEATFRKEARQTAKAYPTTHRPLVSYCKANHIPIIAANAPRTLVKAYRKTDDDYATFLTGRSDAERASLPRTTSTPDDAYRDRFLAFMSGSRGPAFFRAQALWDDAMAEAVTDFREAHPDTQVLLVIGAFHVSHNGGTVTKIRARRPADRITSLVMDMANPPLTFDDEDKAVGTVLVKVPAPPKQPAPTEP